MREYIMEYMAMPLLDLLAITFISLPRKKCVALFRKGDMVGVIGLLLCIQAKPTSGSESGGYHFRY